MGLSNLAGSRAAHQVIAFGRMNLYIIPIDWKNQAKNYGRPLLKGSLCNAYGMARVKIGFQDPDSYGI